MDSTDYKKIASRLLEHGLVDRNTVKQAIRTHRKQVENGEEGSFLTFLVENNLITQDDAEALFPDAYGESSSTHEEEDPAEQPAEEDDFYEQFRSRKSKSTLVRYSVIFICLLGLGGISWYVYSQHQRSTTAKQLLSRSKSLVRQHRYEKATSIVTHKLLTRYSDLDVADAGRTLKSNVENVRKREKNIRKHLKKWSSVLNSSEDRAPENALADTEKKLKKLRQFRQNYETFFQSKFGASPEQSKPAPILQKLSKHRKRLTKRRNRFWKTVYRNHKKDVRSHVEQGNYGDALELANSFQSTYDHHASTKKKLSTLTRQWIQQEFDKTRKRIRQLEQENKYDQATRLVNRALKQFKFYSFQKQLNKDRKRLTRQNVAARENDSGGKTKTKESNTSTDESSDDGHQGIGPAGDPVDVVSKESDPEENEPDGDTTTSRPSDEPTSDVPFNYLVLFTTDDQKISGRVIEVTDQRVKLDTGDQTVTHTLSDIQPSSAGRLLFAAGQEERAIAYTMEQGAYNLARTLLAAKTKQDQAWKKASVKAGDAFLDGAVQMSPSTLRKTANKKENWLRKKAQKESSGKSYSEKPVQSVKSIVYKGDVSRRLDIVFVNDGWTAEGQSRYNQLCNKLVKRLLTVKPFSNYRRYINFHRVNLVSENTSIDGNTVLGTKRRDDDILVSNYQKAHKYASYAPDTDLVVNVVNAETGRATGSKGLRPGVITINTNGRMSPTFIHELGHAFGGLDDEYVDQSVASNHPKYGKGEEDEHVNTTRVSDPLKVKWHYWRFPKPPKGRAVGTYEGAYYRSNGFYRPSPNCRMKNASKPFCVVCFEQMETSFYHHVSPLDVAKPSGQHVNLFRNENRKLLVRTLVTTTSNKQFGALKADWFLNGTPVEPTDSDMLRTWINTGDLSLPPGTHELGVHLNFLNKRVRRDHGLLSDSHVWTLHVRPYPKPQLRIGNSRRITPGSNLTLHVKLDPGSRKKNLRIKPLSLPPGAQFKTKQNTFTWTPTNRQTGSHIARFGVVTPDNEVVLKKTISFSVHPGNRSNHKPVMYLPPRRSIREGESITFQPNAWDPDHDFLTFHVKNAPKNMFIHPRTGRIHWNVSYRKGSKRKTITITATDGQKHTSRKMVFEVKDRPLPDYDSLDGYQAKRFLRKRDPDVVTDVFDQQLTNLPDSFQFLESIRLLRHAAPSIRSKAINRIETLLPSQGQSMQKRLLNLLFSRVKMHMFHFTDSPNVLDFLSSLVQKSKPLQGVSKRAKPIYERLQKIRTYNKKRGVTR